MNLRQLSSPLALLLLSALVACGARSELDLGRRGSGPDAARDSGTDSSTPDAARDGSLSDSGVDTGAPCPEDCDDGLFCNGIELCIDGECVSAEAPACDDGNECTEDRCNERDNECFNVEVDVDRDGDGITSCSGDCDDRNPRIFPGAEEVCDGLDNNCNGAEDEGVISECGDCRLGCRIHNLPTDSGGSWSDVAEEISGIDEEGGSLTLSRTRTETNHAWVANTEGGTITKVNLLTGEQLGEFDGVLLDGTNGAQALDVLCDGETEGNCPSRTAVDLRGNVFVANRSFGHQGTVTKIAHELEDCIDRNGNGRIDTSSDRNADGRISADEFLGQEDECLLWTVDVGGIPSIPRAIAIDRAGTVWVGLFGERAFVQLDPETGETIRRIGLFGGVQPYGAAIGSDGVLWTLSPGAGLMTSIDTEEGVQGPVLTPRTRDDCAVGYGIAIDNEDRVWVAGFLCDSVMRYDPIGNRWFEVPLPDDAPTRGVAADDRGNIFVSASHEYIRFRPGGADIGPAIARVYQFSAEDGSGMRVHGTADRPLPGGGTVGLGLDARGNVWGVNQVSASVFRLNPTTGVATEFPVGNFPYTYSDFTGYALRTFTAPSGIYRTRIEGCSAGPTEWEEMIFDASVPPGASVEVRARTAAVEARLDDAAWQPLPLESPISLESLRRESWLELEFQLVASEDDASPRINRADVQLNCPL